MTIYIRPLKTYGFTPYDAMIRYSMCRLAKYADFAIALVDAKVASEETAIAAGLQTMVWQIPGLAEGTYFAKITCNGMELITRLAPNQ